MTFDGIGGIRRRSSSDRLVSDPLIGRVDGKRRQEPVWFGTKLKRMFLKSIGVRSESKAPKTMPNNFLAELWNRGSRYSSVATLRALIHLAESKTELDYSALDKESAFRLRKNLLDHGELPRAIAAVRKNVETWNSSERKTKVLEFLDGLLGTLKENFHELSSRTGQSGTKGRKPDTQEQDRLHSILAAAAYKSVCVHAGKRVRSPAELAQTELTKLDAKPAPKSAPPAESVPPAPQTYDDPKIRQTFERWGIIEPGFLKMLLREAFEILESKGIRGSGDDIDRYLNSFEKADSATRNLFLVALTETLQSQDHLGIHVALADLEEAAPLGCAMDVKTFTTSNRPDGDGEPTSQYLRARYLIHDIARGLSDVKDEDLAQAVGAALVKSKVTKDEAAAFTKYAGALQLGGQSKIVRDTIAEYAEKIDDYGAVKRRFQSTGLVDPEVAENLTRDAFQRQGKPITEEELQEFLADFTSAATGRRDYVLNRLLDAG
jgi:hypothetical protein